MIEGASDSGAAQVVAPDDGTVIGALRRGDEVEQDTWLGVIQGIWAFAGRSSLKTWILRILINRAKTRGAREGRIVLSPRFDAAIRTGPGRRHRLRQQVGGNHRPRRGPAFAELGPPGAGSRGFQHEADLSATPQPRRRRPVRAPGRLLERFANRRSHAEACLRSTTR